MAKDLTNIYKIDEAKGLVKYTVKAYGVYYTGKSKVNVEAGDVFDLEKGKRLAKLRAILKMKKGVLKNLLEFQEMVRYYASLEDEIQEQIQVLTQSATRLTERINNELGEDNVETPVEQ
jgi:hypothetical protein